jgi:phosphate starvation-inducible PhoH-like protein
MSSAHYCQRLTLEPADNARLANFCGHENHHLRHLEQRLQVEIANRGHDFEIKGLKSAVATTCNILEQLFISAATEHITPELIHLTLQDSKPQENNSQKLNGKSAVMIKTKRGVIKGRGYNQQAYLQKIFAHAVNFGIGPAGTGKTYLAVACAVEALQTEQVQRIVLVRPAVEAGEKLGFLPGNMAQKVDPYLRPLYDALYEMLGYERVEKLLERQVIEIAPLAFMRGRSISDAFIILDEAQNTTPEQLKMFLTRLGFGSTAVITGDITQVDLPTHQSSGLRHVLEILQHVEGISFTFFEVADVVRHPLVQRIVAAYESYHQVNA